MTWDEVRELRREGVLFGSHTVNHPKLHELPWDDIRTELAVSRDCLEQQLQEYCQQRRGTTGGDDVQSAPRTA